MFFDVASLASSFRAFSAPAIGGMKLMSQLSGAKRALDIAADAGRPTREGEDGDLRSLRLMGAFMSAGAMLSPALVIDAAANSIGAGYEGPAINSMPVVRVFGGPPAPGSA